jgi:hypothetical protein
VEKLTFKQYVDSKNQLLAAIEETPIHTSTYCVKKYCKLVIGESKNDKDSIPLKPSNIIKVKWLYDDPDNPKPLSLTFEGVRGIINESEHKVYWSGSKLLEWLGKNSTEKLDVFNK